MLIWEIGFSNQWKAVLCQICYYTWRLWFIIILQGSSKDIACLCCDMQLFKMISHRILKLVNHFLKDSDSPKHHVWIHTISDHFRIRRRVIVDLGQQFGKFRVLPELFPDHVLMARVKLDVEELRKEHAH